MERGSRHSTGATLLVLAAAAVSAKAAKQQLWPDQWHVLAPLRPAALAWADPAEGLHAEGVRGLWRSRTQRASTLGGAQWSQVTSSEDGSVAFQLPGGSQAWAVGEFQARKSRCYQVEIDGTVVQAFLGERVLTPGWPAQLQLPKGGATIFVRLRGHGLAQLKLRLSPCVRRVRILEESEDSLLPEVVNGSTGSVVHLRVHNDNSAWVRGMVLRLPLQVNPHVEAADGAQPPPMSLAPGQAAPISLRVQLRPQAIAAGLPCPVELQLQLEAEEGLEAPLQVSRRLKCRKPPESFLMTFLDEDGSPQMAGLRAPTRPCSQPGCPVLLSLHGMDVPASRQAYAYNPKEQVWVLAPHGRSSFAGLNWQNQGHRSAWAALTALADFSMHYGGGGYPADVSRVVFTGHSNGGFGALLLAAERPELALGVAPLAGMLRMGRPQDGIAGADRTWQHLQSLFDASVAAYDLSLVAGNVVGVPCMARTGAKDEVIAPASTQQLVRAVREGGGDCSAVEVPGKGHWWWDSDSANDGGAVDDAQMNDFWKRCLQQKRPPLPSRFTFRCLSLDVCGGRGGLRLLQQEAPFELSAIHVARGKRQKATKDKAEASWEVRTENLLALGWSDAPPGGLSIDGHAFSLEDLTRASSACRRAGSKKWQLCPSAAKCCLSVDGRRTPAQAATLRAVLSGALQAVVGTSGLPGSFERHVDAAVALANGAFSVGGGRMSIVLDTDEADREEGQNLLLLGGPGANNRSAHLLSQGVLPNLSFSTSGQVHLGPCSFEGDLAVLVLGPVPGGESVFALLEATSSAGLSRLLAALGGLRERNLWQVRLPDYLIVEAPGKSSKHAGLLAAGYWGGASGWEWTAHRGFANCINQERTRSEL
eukprot:TRINITY_DN17082_c0_g1_i1.p1 TRINITY_DN17082_c0_g1~~TRINITY_DN17082_c0_g1_i1.p1  ORF type:complete len:891 (-),score=181.20 TRINITY_DN17082_c0_g1_i1:85-2706(-)